MIRGNGQQSLQQLLQCSGDSLPEDAAMGILYDRACVAPLIESIDNLRSARAMWITNVGSIIPALTLVRMGGTTLEEIVIHVTTKEKQDRWNAARAGLPHAGHIRCETNPDVSGRTWTVLVGDEPGEPLLPDSWSIKYQLSHDVGRADAFFHEALGLPNSPLAFPGTDTLSLRDTVVLRHAAEYVQIMEDSHVHANGDALKKLSNMELAQSCDGAVLPDGTVRIAIARMCWIVSHT